MSDRPAPAFDLDAFRAQIARLRASGSIRASSGRSPALRELWDRIRDPDFEVDRIEAILDAMTPEERRDPGSIDVHATCCIAVAARVNSVEVKALVCLFQSLARLRRSEEMGPLDTLTLLCSALATASGRAATCRASAPDPATLAHHRDLVRQLIGPARYDRTLGPWSEHKARDLRLWDFTNTD